MFLPPISHLALGTSSCHCCVSHHALGTSSCHSRVPISHWSVCYRRAHHVGQHHWGHQASHAHLWWTETGLHQTPYSSISSRQCLAPGWGSIVFPLPHPPPHPPYFSVTSTFVFPSGCADQSQYSTEKHRSIFKGA